MSHIKKVIQAIKIKMKLNRLSKAKENSMREFLGLPPRTTWYEEFSETVMTCVKDKCCQIFFPCCMYDRNRRKKRLTCWDSPVFKDFIGFLGGVLLTLLLFFLLIYQMDVHPRVAFLICSLTSCLLTTVMAFSDTVRCLVLLMLPQFFSGKGRMLLLMYALFLAINHPLMNVNKNIAVLAQSTTCGQEMALNGTKELVRAATAPIESIMDSIKGVISKLLDFSNGLRKMYTTLENGVEELANTVEGALQWVTNMVDKCNEKLGSPYKKCREIFNSAERKCRKKIFLKFLCKIAGKVGDICNIVRISELLCKLAKLVQKLLKSSLGTPTKKALQSAREMFYFNVTIDYNFNYTFHQSKSYSDIRKDISSQIHKSVDSFIEAVGVARNFMIFGILFIVIQALIYRSKWLSDDRYDNFYITFTVKDLEERRKERGKPGIFPLKFDEQCTYVSSMSSTMVWKEKKKLAFGLVIFILSFFNAAFYLFCDFGLYQVLYLINKHFGVLTKVPVPPHTKLHVSGDGPMADMYRSIVTMFDPLTESKVQVDVTSCVPHPSEPDWATYKLIGFIYLVCLLLTICEAYGLRLRHIIMSCYFPKRERLRALWLYNHIMKTRGGLMETAKDKIRKRNSGDLDVDHISLMGRFAASFPICEIFFKWLGWEVKSCLYCGREGKPDDYFNFVHCAYYDCNAVFCIECYADLDNICPVCLKAVQVNDSDVSEEIDSSMSERDKVLTGAQKMAKENKIQRLKMEGRASHQLAGIRQQFDMPSGSPTNKPKHLAKGVASVKSSNRTNVNDNRNAENHRLHVGKSNNAFCGLQSQSDSSSDQYGSEYLKGRKYGHGCDKCNSALVIREFEQDSSDSDTKSDCSSVCTDDLDFSYQYVKKEDIVELPDDYCDHIRRKRSLALVDESIYSDTDSELEGDNDTSPHALVTQPTSVVILRG